MPSSSPLYDLFSGIETDTPPNFKSHLLIKQKIETRLSELKDQHADNLHLITEAEKQTKAFFIKLKINFIEAMLADVRMSDLLFGDVHSLDVKKVQKTFLQLSLEFHPDKCSDISRPELTKIFFQGILNIKDDIIHALSNPTQKTSAMPATKTSTTAKTCVYPDEKQSYPEEVTALKAWETAIDYQNALKKNFKFKHLKWDLTGVSNESLIKLRKEFAMEAYEQYAIACCHADRDQNIYKRISLRKAMAMSLYLADDPYHAQLYTLGVINLLLDKSMTFANVVRGGKILLPYVYTLSFLDELLIFLNKISNKTTVLKTEGAPIISSFAQAFMADKKHKRCLDDLSELQSLVKKDLMSFCPDTSFTLSESECRSTLIPIEEKSVPTSKSFFVGLYGLFMQYDTDQKKVRDPGISNQLQKIINDALPFYYSGEYHTFLLILSREIASNDGKEKLRLFCYGEHIYNPRDFVDMMLGYGYQPEGLARLIILISNAVFHLEKGYRATIFTGLLELQYLSSLMLDNIIFNDELKKANAMPEKMCLLSKIAAMRLVMHKAMSSDPLNEKQAVLPYLTSLMDEQEKVLLVHQQWLNRVIVFIRHMITALGLSQESSSFSLTQKDVATPKSYLHKLSVVAAPKLTVTTQENNARTVAKNHCSTP